MLQHDREDKKDHSEIFLCKGWIFVRIQTFRRRPLHPCGWTPSLSFLLLEIPKIRYMGRRIIFGQSDRLLQYILLTDKVVMLRQGLGSADVFLVQENPLPPIFAFELVILMEGMLGFWIVGYFGLDSVMGCPPTVATVALIILTVPLESISTLGFVDVEVQREDERGADEDPGPVFGYGRSSTSWLCSPCCISSSGRCCSTLSGAFLPCSCSSSSSSFTPSSFLFIFLLQCSTFVVKELLHAVWIVTISTILPFPRDSRWHRQGLRQRQEQQGRCWEERPSDTCSPKPGCTPWCDESVMLKWYNKGLYVLLVRPLDVLAWSWKLCKVKDCRLKKRLIRSLEKWEIQKLKKTLP